MMELYVYNPNDLTEHVFEQYLSLRWRRKYYEPGEVEMHVLPTRENIALFQPEAVIYRTTDFDAIEIEGIHIKGDDMTVTGRMLGCLLNRKVNRLFRFRGTPEDAMRQAAQNAGLALGIRHGYAGQASVDLRLHTSGELCEKIGVAYGLGYRVTFEGRVPKFEVYAGKDRSVAGEADGVSFSDDDDMLINPGYTLDTSGLCNVAIVAGEGEGDARKIIRVAKESPYAERELYVDAKDLQKEEGQTDAEYEALLRQRGLEKLAERELVNCFEANVNTSSHLYAYGKNWDLGDIAEEYHKEWGIRQKLRITEVEEVYENGVMTVTPTFGTPYPEAIKLGGI